VVPPVELFNKLYGELRAQLLSRHFAIGRYFRADHLSFTRGCTPDRYLLYQGTFVPVAETVSPKGNALMHA